MSVEGASVGEQRFIGGFLVRRGVRRWSATRPLAELIVDRSLIRVRPRSKWNRRLFLGRFPLFELALEGARAEPIGRMLERGIKLSGTIEGDYRSGFFACNKRTQQRLIDLLRERGVTIG